MPKIWIDLANPSHPHFFNAILPDLKKKNQIQITARERGETVKLANQMKPIVFGSHPENSIMKSISIIIRSILLFKFAKDFDYALSFENVMSVIYANIKHKKSILFLDNDLKYILKDKFIHNYESRIKLKADFIIIPKICYETISKYAKQSKIITYNGYKEDIYIADYEPDYKVKEKIPYEKFVVVRPEALRSFYVKDSKSIVPSVLKQFEENSINVVYLPREKSDIEYAQNYHVHIPKEPLNGLDLCYYSDAVLTGSGTMAREAACLGKPSVSFFPGKNLLSVDKKLIEEKKMFHSRDPEEITNYVLSKETKNSVSLDLQRSKNVKKEVLKIIERIIHEN